MKPPPLMRYVDTNVLSMKPRPTYNFLITRLTLTFTAFLFSK